MVCAAHHNEQEMTAQRISPKAADCLDPMTLFTISTHYTHDSSRQLLNRNTLCFKAETIVCRPLSVLKPPLLQLTDDLCMIQAKEYYRCLLRLLLAARLLQWESSQASYPPEIVIGYHYGYCPAGFQGGWGPLLLGLTPLPAWTRSWMPDAALPLCSINDNIALTTLSPPTFNRNA